MEIAPSTRSNSLFDSKNAKKVKVQECNQRVRNNLLQLAFGGCPDGLDLVLQQRAGPGTSSKAHEGGNSTIFRRRPRYFGKETALTKKVY